MSHYGIPKKCIFITQKQYEDPTSQVIHKGKLTKPFTVTTGVRQGCMLSPMIFLMVIDWIMLKTKKKTQESSGVSSKGWKILILPMTSASTYTSQTKSAI